MTANDRRLITACITVTPLFLGVSPLAHQIAGMEVSINSKATYLRTNLDPGALGSTPVNLTMLNILPGDILRLEQLGDFDCGTPCVDDRTAMIGLFSGSTTLLSGDQLHRVPAAIKAGQDFTTSLTNFGSLPTDIAEDFRIIDTIVVTPLGSTHLFIAAHDSLYQDNVDPDNDFAVRITELAELSGDYNRNGTVDAADYVVWRNLSGQTGTGLVADGNRDGIVNQADYDIWRAHFGETAVTSAATSTVPEPASRVLMMFAASLLSRRRRY